VSLSAIRAQRLDNVKPALVSLVIGPAPAWFDDDETAIVIPEHASPEFMDWRPVVGLTLAVFQTKPLPELTLRVIGEIERAGANLFGYADHTGAHPLTLGATDAHRANLQRTWESLCKS
jgi:hypothetical protein